MNILVAGGGGYIGTKLCEKLYLKEHYAQAIDLFWFGNHLDSSIDFKTKDIKNISEHDLRGFDCVIFLGGLSNDPMAEFDPYLNFAYNASLPVYLAYLCKKAGIPKYIFASSCSVYGSVKENQILHEKSKIAPHFPYGIAKLQAETALLNMANEKFQVISLRKGTIGGYSKRMRFDLVLNAMFASAVKNNVIYVNNPNIWRPILSVEDACRAYVKCAESDFKKSDIFNLHYGNYTLLNIAQQIQKYFIDRSMFVEININQNSDPRSYRLSNKKIKKDLKFYPKIDISNIVHDLYLNCSNVTFSDDIYNNINTFKKLKQNDSII